MGMGMRMGGWMEACMHAYACMPVCILDGCMDICIYGCIFVIDGCVDGWMLGHTLSTPSPITVKCLAPSQIAAIKGADNVVDNAPI